MYDRAKLENILSNTQNHIPELKTSYLEACKNVSKGKETSLLFKVWTRSTINKGLTEQVKGNVLLTLIGYIGEEPKYFVRSGDLKTNPNENEKVPLDTIYNSFLSEEQKELLGEALKIVPSLGIIVRNVPIFLEGIILSGLKERDSEGKIIPNGEEYDSFSIRLPEVQIKEENLFNLTIQNSLFIPLTYEDEETEKYKYISQLNAENQKRGRKASNSRGTSFERQTPRGNKTETPNYNLIKDTENISI